MIKKLTLILGLFTSVFVFGQKLEEIIPPAPEASAISKHGNLNINESSGTFNHSIPIYNFNYRGINVPISLNYSGNGIKVNDISTWTGVNWVLNAGGVITRTVNGNIDELTDRVSFNTINSLHYQYYNALTTSNILINAFQYYNYFNLDLYDTRPDMFSFNFNGISGSFVFKDNFEPVLIKGDNSLKIEVVGSSNETNKDKFKNNKYFIITTSNGDKYHFGSLEKQDTKRVLISPEHTILTDFATTSFYLFKIETANNDVVNFEYDYTNNYRVILDNSVKKKAYYERPIDGGYTYLIGDLLETGNEHPTPLYDLPENTGVVYSRVAQDIDKGVFLKSIISGDNKTKVSFIANENHNGNFTFKKSLEKIKVEYDNSILKVAKLNYHYYSNNNVVQRFVLKDVTFNSNDHDWNAIKVQKYGLNYKSLSSIPERFSNAQDHLGYYNGGTSSSNVIAFPINSNYYFTGFGSVNKDSSFEDRTSGVLEKISYPTGGHSKIEYEAPIERHQPIKKDYLQVYHGGFDNHTNYHEDISYDLANVINEAGSSSQNQPLFEDQLISLNLKVQSTNNNIPKSNVFSIEVIDVTNFSNQTTQVFNVVNLPNSNINLGNLSYIDKQTFNFLGQKNHYYKIKLKLNPIYVGNIPMTAQLNYSFIGDYEVVEGNGIRVKRISDYTNGLSTIPAQSKRYYYHGIENINSFSKDFVKEYEEPKYIVPVDLPLLKYGIVSSLGNVNKDPASCELFPHPGGVFYSTPQNYKTDSIFKYDKVLISLGGDNFENGGIEKSYKNEVITPVKINAAPWVKDDSYIELKESFKYASWVSPTKGDLTEEKYFSKENGTIYLKKAVAYEKSFEKTIDSLTIPVTSKIMDDCGGIPNYNYKNLTLGFYKIYQTKIKDRKVVTKEYLEPYPMTLNAIGQLPDESGYNIVTTSTVENFNSLYNGLPTEIKVSSSDSDKEQVIKNYYVDQVSSLSGLTSVDELHYAELGLQHKIGAPIQTESYQRGTNVSDKLLSKQRTLYKVLSGKVLPDKVLSSKGTQSLEERIIYHKYDTTGNPIEVSQKNGTKIYYIWGYNQTQPIAKIQGYTDAQIINIQSLINTAITESNEDNDRTIDSIDSSGNVTFSGKEGDLRAALNNIRNNSNMSNSQVTTFTYDPLIGVTSITDPRERVVYYDYDDFHRLRYIKDHEGNVLSKKEYNYKR
jgi:YD repeat-containing protein